jgi:AraC-like DNA-binding protein
MPVAEVALRAGFFDQSHLHRHFLPTLGITPARYAELMRSNVQDGGRRAS